MKKILFLLLISIATYGQARFPEGIKLGGNGPTVSTSKLISQDVNGNLNYIDAANLPLSTADINSLKKKADLSTGLLKNGLISINADPTKFNISAGIGIISNFDDPQNPVSTIITFPAFTGVTPTYLLTGNITYIAINSTPAVVMQATPFTDTQRRDLIILGAAVHSNHININVVNNISAPSNAIGNQLHDFIEAVGPLNLTGNKYSANGANLSLNKSAGTIFKFGVNFATNWKDPHVLSQSAGTALTFRYRTQNGTEGSDVTVINPALYDVSNVLTAVPNNKFSIQTVTMFQTGLTRIQYGQNVYDDLASAQAAIFTRDFNVEANIKENGITRAYIIVKNNATSLQNATDARIIEAQKFGGVASGGVALTFANIVSALGYTPANDVNVIHTTGKETKTGELILNTTQKANGEQFNAESGENVLGLSVPVIESQSGGTGTDFTPSSAVVAIKFTTSPTASFIQGLSLKLKKSGALTDDSKITVVMYTDNAGVPGVQTGGGGSIYGNELLTTYKDLNVIIQNVTTPVSVSTPYWLIITRTESGGTFVFNSTVGTGTTFQGATPATATTETNVQISNIIYARNAYGGHFVGNYSHGVWGTSLTGVGVRGDSHSHFGGYFQSNNDWGARGTSVNSGGVLGVSTNGAGLGAQTSSLTVPAIRADNTNGITYPVAYLNGRSNLIGRTTVGAATDYNATFESVGGLNRFSGNVILNVTGVDVSTQNEGFKLDVVGEIRRKTFAVNTLYSRVGNGDMVLGTRGGGTVPLLATRTSSSTATGFFVTALQNADVARTGDSDFVFKTGFETGSDAIQTLTTTGAAFQVYNGNNTLLNIYRNGNVSIGNPPDALFKLDVQGTGRFTGLLNLSGQTASTIAIFDASKNLISASTATYPSLTELSYVKGVTSAIQTQINAKADLASPALTGTPTAPTASAGTNTTQLATTAFVQSATRPYKAYTVLITQTGTSAPTAIVLENGLTGTITYSYSSTGTYLATLTGAFTIDKTWTMINTATNTSSYSATASRINSNDVQIITANASGTLANDVLLKAPFEIRVYN